MKILDIKSLNIPDVQVISYGRFQDERGYFSESFRKSDFFESDILKGIFSGYEFVQANESYSKVNVLRGLHFQWLPYMGKLVRTIRGHMIDIVLDIRKESKTFGKILLYDMPSMKDDVSNEWIWLPPGFAHGNFFLEETVIEYYCTGSYSPKTEAGISPFASDIDWSICDLKLKKLFDSLNGQFIISEKDSKGYSLSEWLKDERSDFFK